MSNEIVWQTWGNVWTKSRRFLLETTTNSTKSFTGRSFSETWSSELRQRKESRKRTNRKQQEVVEKYGVSVDGSSNRRKLKTVRGWRWWSWTVWSSRSMIVLHLPVSWTLHGGKWLTSSEEFSLDHREANRSRRPVWSWDFPLSLNAASVKPDVWILKGRFGGNVAPVQWRLMKPTILVWCKTVQQITEWKLKYPELSNQQSQIPHLDSDRAHLHSRKGKWNQEI